MALETTSQWKDPVRHLKKGIISEPQGISHPHGDLKNSWQSFIDSLMREWKTLNIVSVLLLWWVFFYSFIFLDSFAIWNLWSYSHYFSSTGRANIGGRCESPVDREKLGVGVPSDVSQGQRRVSSA
jgi:hypothetical protein